MPSPNNCNHVVAGTGGPFPHCVICGVPMVNHPSMWWISPAVAMNAPAPSTFCTHARVVPAKNGGYECYSCAAPMIGWANAATPAVGQYLASASGQKVPVAPYTPSISMPVKACGCEQGCTWFFYDRGEFDIQHHGRSSVCHFTSHTNKRICVQRSGVAEALWGCEDCFRIYVLENPSSAGLHIIIGGKISLATGPIASCVCLRCNASNEYASPNQPDGSYVCYECR